ncbi:unnamed protein product, partial [Bubo scandiacus]
MTAAPRPLRPGPAAGTGLGPARGDPRRGWGRGCRSGPAAFAPRRGRGAAGGPVPGPVPPRRGGCPPRPPPRPHLGAGLAGPETDINAGEPSGRTGAACGPDPNTRWPPAPDPAEPPNISRL